jgi:hypothetical protein
MTDRPARLLGDGTVILTRHGAQLVHVALELVARQAAARHGGAAPTDDFAWLCAVVRLAAERPEGCPPATSGEPIVVTLPPSSSTLTVTETAAIWGTSAQAIRKAIKAGRLPAKRHGRVWVISEYEARHRAPLRRANGKQRVQREAAPGHREAGRAQSSAGGGVGEDGRGR